MIKKICYHWNYEKGIHILLKNIFIYFLTTYSFHKTKQNKQIKKSLQKCVPSVEYFIYLLQSLYYELFIYELQNLVYKLFLITQACACVRARARCVIDQNKQPGTDDYKSYMALKFHLFVLQEQATTENSFHIFRCVISLFILEGDRN